MKDNPIKLSVAQFPNILRCLAASGQTRRCGVLRNDRNAETTREPRNWKQPVCLSCQLSCGKLRYSCQRAIVMLDRPAQQKRLSRVRVLRGPAVAVRALTDKSLDRVLCQLQASLRK